MTTAHDELVRQVGGIRAEVETLLSGWAADSESRAAQLAFDGRLGVGVEALAAALGQVRAVLAAVREDAHDAEVRNVAILD